MDGGEIDASAAGQAAATIIGRATRRLLTADGGLTVGDVEGAFAAAYDAYRMAAEALLIRHGLLRHDATLRQAQDHAAPVRPTLGANGVPPVSVLPPRRAGYGARTGESPIGTSAARLAVARRAFWGTFVVVDPEPEPSIGAASWLGAIAATDWTA